MLTHVDTFAGFHVLTPVVPDIYQDKVRTSELCTVQSLYNTPLDNTELDITRSCCSPRIFVQWNFTKVL